MAGTAMFCVYLLASQVTRATTGGSCHIESRVSGYVPCGTRPTRTRWTILLEFSIWY